MKWGKHVLHLQRRLDWFLKFLATRAVKQKLIQQTFEIYNKRWVSHGSGQIIIFHQPRFPWKKGISLSQLHFGVRSCEVAIIWPNGWSYSVDVTKQKTVGTMTSKSDHGGMAAWGCAWTPESWAWTAAASWNFLFQKPRSIQGMSCSYPGIKICTFLLIFLSDGIGTLTGGVDRILRWNIHWLLVETAGWSPSSPRWYIVMELLWQIRVLPRF